MPTKDKLNDHMTKAFNEFLDKNNILFKENSKIDPDLIPELTGQIIDIFEDFLDTKQITIPNPERDEYKSEDPLDTVANIYGEDYDYLETQIKETLKRWNLI